MFVRKTIYDLDTLAETMLKNKELHVRITSHTRMFIKVIQAVRITGKRARKIEKYLINKGIKSSRIICMGVGRTIPFAKCNPVSEVRLNERTEVSYSIGYKICNYNIPDFHEPVYLIYHKK